MNKVELLELAAKAIGNIDKDGDFFYTTNKYGALCKWDPLSEDADAFRLAVMLGFSPNCSYDLNLSAVALGNGTSIVEYHNGDPCGATRLAIVKAAADIGSRMGIRHRRTIICDMQQQLMKYGVYCVVARVIV